MRKEAKQYHAKHNEKRKIKTVSFRIDSPSEKLMLDFIESLPNFSEWVKSKIQSELNK